MVRHVVTQRVPTRLGFGDDARSKLMRGAAILAKAVSGTLGPNGRSVIIDGEFGLPIVTRDGATVAASISLPDPDEQMGARLLSDAALNVLKAHGDGTTTTVVIAEQLLSEAHRLVMSGYEPSQLAKEIREGFQVVRDAVMAQAQELTPEQIPDVVASSCKGDQRIVDAVSAAYAHVEHDGTVVINDGDRGVIEVVTESGFRVDKGWVQMEFGRHEPTLGLGETFVLVSPTNVHDIRQIRDLMEFCVAAKKSLLVVAKAVTGTALRAMVENNAKGALRCCAVQAPFVAHVQGMLLEDLACWTGGRVAGLGAHDLTRLVGYAKSVSVTKDRTVLTDPDPHTTRAKERISYLQSILPNMDTEYDEDQVARCIGRLIGKVAEIKVGAPTDPEREQLKQQVEDAIGAVRTAMREGVVPGGGHALLAVSHRVDGDTAGMMALRRSIARPAAKIAENGGLDQCLPSSPEIIDPCGVVVATVQAAVSTACLMLMTECTMHYRRNGDTGLSAVGYR